LIQSLCLTKADSGLWRVCCDFGSNQTPTRVAASCSFVTRLYTGELNAEGGGAFL
jgi:hypothetical protein